MRWDQIVPGDVLLSTASRLAFVIVGFTGGERPKHLVLSLLTGRLVPKSVLEGGIPAWISVWRGSELLQIGDKSKFG